MLCTLVHFYMVKGVCCNVDFVSMAERSGYTSVDAIDRSFPFGTVSYSIDKIRFDLLFDYDKVLYILHWLDSLPGDMFTSFRTFKYKYFFRIDVAAEVSFQVGVGYNDLKDFRPRKGFLEFNPNKVVFYESFRNFYASFFKFVTMVSIKRWDLAADITVDRKCVRMEKDQRSYSYLNNRGITEYLGQRSSPWRCKLYDKQREAGLAVPLTRFEITVGGVATYDEVLKHWPRVRISGCTDNELVLGLNDTQLVLCELLEQSPDMELYLKRVGRKTRQKLEPYLYRKQGMLILPADVYKELVESLMRYARGELS